jgi:uncharacterized protein YqhQ
MKKRIEIGGQAVIEGVMMRGPEYIATAIRRKDDSIEIKREPFVSITKRNKVLGLPIIRGFVSLIEMLIIGIKTLNFSATRAELDFQDEKKKKKSKIMENIETFFSYVLAFGLAFLLFAYLPYQIAEWLQLGKENVFFNIFAGIIRIIFFVLYVWLISHIKDIKRVFEYHGAEHKSVFAYESDADLKAEFIQKFSTKHPRCGTSFIFLVLLISILVFSIVDTIYSNIWGVPSVFTRIGYHLLMLPIISGISYEILKFSGKRINHPLVKLITYPGMALQNITTKSPDDKQIEIALLAMKSALGIEIANCENCRFLKE